MAKNQWKDAKSKRPAGRFIQLPCCVLNSKAFLGLSMHGRSLLIDMVVQYQGNNNGDLSATWRLMKARGWRSQDTLHKAKKELLASGLIVETRVGARPNKASLYAMTFWAIDFCGGKLDMLLRNFPRGQWSLAEPAPPLVEGTRSRKRSEKANTPSVAVAHA